MMNAEVLREALEGNTNEAIYETSNEIIQAKKKKLFQEMGMSREEISNAMNILIDYKWVEALTELIPGRYVRWIDTRISENDNYFVERGGLFCHLEKRAEDNDELLCLCRNIGGKYFKLQMGDFLMFQKLTKQEKIILRAIDMLMYERRQKK